MVNLHNECDLKSEFEQSIAGRSFTLETVRAPRNPCCGRSGFVPDSAQWPDSASESGGLRVSEDPPQDRLTLPFSRSGCQSNGRENGEPNYGLGSKGCKSVGDFDPSADAECLLDRRALLALFESATKPWTLKHVAPSKMIGAGTEAGIVIQAGSLARGKRSSRNPYPCPCKTTSLSRQESR